MRRGGLRHIRPNGAELAVGLISRERIRSLRLQYALHIFVGNAVPGVPELFVAMRNAEDSIPY